MRIPLLFRCLGALALVHIAPAALADTEVQSVQSLFAKMSRVSHTLNYQGSFTFEHQHNPTLQGFRVSHWVVDGVEYERLQYLSGPEREIVRRGQQLDCMPPGDQLLQGRLTQIGARLAGLDELYHFQAHYVERVAGRLTSVLQVVPRDTYRYGYILSVDQETGLVLKSLMVDGNGRILERYQFVELELNPNIAELEQTPPAKRQRVANPNIGECNQTQMGEPQGWQLTWVPSGFAFVGQRKLNDTREMLMYTDGLTTFSVFVEPATSPPPEGIGQRGATVLYMSKVLHQRQAYRVTVVGEIPAAAAEQIAMGFRSRVQSLN